ncbi:MAG: PEGA domain-containing protein [Roseburia sp.]
MIKKVRQGILGCLLAVVLLTVGCGSSDREETDTGQREEIAESSEWEAPESLTDEDAKLYIVAGNDTAQGLMSFYNISSGSQEQYIYTDGTFFRDKYGEIEPVSSFTPGSVVTLSCRNRSIILEQVQFSSEAWLYEDVNGFALDEEKQIFEIAGTKYSYDEGLKVYSGEESVTLQALTSDDILRVQGVGRKLLSVSVTTGHGTLTLSNTELFEGGWLSLNHNRYYKITENMQLELPEGVYELTVANDGYGDTTEITISRDQESVVDLDTLKGEGPKFCSLIFAVGDLEAAVYVDGQEVAANEPVQIKYGIHRVQIDAEGYDVWSKRLYVNSAEATIEVALEEESVVEETTEIVEETAQADSDSSAVSDALQEIVDTLKDSSSTDSSSSDSYLSTLSDVVDTLTGN